MAQNVKAYFRVNAVIGYNATYGTGFTDLYVEGMSSDGTVDFRTSSGGGAIHVYGIDVTAYNLTSEIETAVKTALQASPFSMTFGANDVVRMLP